MGADAGAGGPPARSRPSKRRAACAGGAAPRHQAPLQAAQRGWAAAAGLATPPRPPAALRRARRPASPPAHARRGRLRAPQVPLGSVTPLAMANPAASSVILLLDERIKSQQAVFVHPLVNTHSLGLSPAAFDAAIRRAAPPARPPAAPRRAAPRRQQQTRSPPPPPAAPRPRPARPHPAPATRRAIGREPVYADLEADPKIDKDSPPDLRSLTEGVEAPAAAAAEPAAAAAAAGTAAPAKQAAPKAAKPAAGKKAAARPDSAKVHMQVRGEGRRACSRPLAGAPAPPAASEAAGQAQGARRRLAPAAAAPAPPPATPPPVAAQISDVGARTEELLQLVSGALLGCKLGEAKAEPYVLRRLQADVEAKLNAMKNAAYTAGYLAGKGQVCAAGDRRFA